MGYSGGPDSKALLYALLQTKAARFLHLAHIDHGWREESAKEAQLLAQEALALDLPFHTIRLQEKPAGNLEEAGREARLSFFRSLFDQIPFQALLLAHHADDAAETALKRVLEGAHLQNVSGMTEVSSLERMTVWRPLLRVKKSALEAVGAFDDPTNRDPKFLRSRLRINILPMLSQSFGKEVSDNLALLSERAAELKEYLDRKVSSIQIEEGPWGKAVYLAQVERIEARHCLLQFGPSSRNIVESILDHLSESNLRFGPFIVDRGWVFLPSSHLPQFGSDVVLAPGRYTSGDWQIEVTPNLGPLPSLTWQDLWKGEFSLAMPQGVLKKGGGSSEEYRVAKVPPFLRPLLPCCNEKTLFTRPSNPCWQVRFFVNVKS